MKQLLTLALTIGLGITGTLALTPAEALAVPMQLNHQGRLLDAGVPATGPQNMTFSI